MDEMPKAYEAKNVEQKWYQFWEKEGCFQANSASEKPAYCISLPPPNVTGALHMGHALGNTLQDILIRWKRMSGYEALWVPGTDHAGIATQTVVERHLIKTTGKRRKDFPREEFLKHTWKWKEDNEDRILSQIRRLGCSCDWSRLRFTMDEDNNRAVRKIFKKLYDDGLIYQGDYLVNWDPVTQTALADDEVEYEEQESKLWYFKYPFSDGSGYAHIATTRPETMLGDTAVAVSPKDARYTSLIGKTVTLPIMKREIPIIADSYVDPKFGSGMVKITPAHDPDDNIIGQNHQLPFINIMTPDGKINENGAHFEGMTMQEAREAVVAEMETLGLVEKIEPYVTRVGVSYRSKAKIEPYMSKQWFIRMRDFALSMRTAVQDGKVKLIPENWESTYYHWIDHLKDWCISRQLWWGHRIPIWYHEDGKQILCYDGDDVPDKVKAEPEKWTQDEDVLDTWFSSALWPFANLGWPEKTPELSKFYPNAVLVTGHDILFFWVARMIMMGEYTMKEVPFPETFLHGLIYGKSYWRKNPEGGITYVGDAERKEYDLGKPIPRDVSFKWEKISKSKGNVIDPLEILEEYGTDAMRMALCASSPQSREIDLDRRRFEEFKNFANKVWNGARFVFLNLGGDDPLSNEEFAQGIDMSLLLLEDRWILSSLNRTIRDVNSKLATYTFDQAALQAYDFFWKEFCSYYVEIAKPILFGKVGTPAQRRNKQKILAIVLCQAIRLIHPMAPFITEELFQLLKEQFKSLTPIHKADPYTIEAIQALQTKSCMLAPYPQVICNEDIDTTINETFDLIGRIIYTIRNIRGEMKLPPSAVTDVHIIGSPNDPAYKRVQNNLNIISALIRTNSITMHSKEANVGLASVGVLDSLRIKIPLPHDLLEKEKARLHKELEKLSTNVERIEKQLNNKEFADKAPSELIEKQKMLLEQSQAELKEITCKLKSFAD